MLMISCGSAWRYIRRLSEPWRARYLWMSLLDLPIYLKLKRQWLNDPTEVTGCENRDIHPQFKSWVRKRAGQIYWGGLGDSGLHSLQIVIANWELRFLRASRDGQTFIIWQTNPEAIRAGEEVFVHSSFDIDRNGTFVGGSMTPAVYKGNGMVEMSGGILAKPVRFWTRKPEWER